MNKNGRALVRFALLSTVAVAALTSGAAMAQTPMPWTGPYVGANLGYEGTSLKLSDPTGVLSVLGSGNTRYTLNNSGAIGGFQAGYNWQMSAFVLGVEGDMDLGSADGGATTPEGFFHSRIMGLGTVRGRLGYAFSSMPLMIFATGGLAFGNVTDTVHSLIASAYSDKQTWRTGWTAGGGGEWMFAPNWSLKAEVLYVDLGNSSVINPGSVGGCRIGFKDNAVVARGGVNFHF